MSVIWGDLHWDANKPDGLSTKILIWALKMVHQSVFVARSDTKMVAKMASSTRDANWVGKHVKQSRRYICVTTYSFSQRSPRYYHEILNIILQTTQLRNKIWKRSTVNRNQFKIHLTHQIQQQKVHNSNIWHWMICDW
jgi:hypothetical protein